MYLIHVQLRSCTHGVALPCTAASLIYRQAAPDEGVQHVEVHDSAEPLPVVGLFLLAERADIAVRHALAVLNRAVAAEPELRDWTPVDAHLPWSSRFSRGPHWPSGSLD